MPTPPTREPFTALDWIAVVLTAGATLTLVGFVAASASFRNMYQDFGSAETLPMLTRVATWPIAPLLLAQPTIILLALGLRARAIGMRRAGVVLAFVWALAAIALLAVGFYMPLWQIADAVRAD